MMKRMIVIALNRNSRRYFIMSGAYECIVMNENLFTITSFQRCPCSAANSLAAAVSN